MSAEPFMNAISCRLCDDDYCVRACIVARTSAKIRLISLICTSSHFTILQVVPGIRPERKQRIKIQVLGLNSQ